MGSGETVRDRLWIALGTLACLLPFLDKALHIDDPLFAWTARQILAHPFDFFGFTLNWYGFVQPMYDVTKNPPLAAYWLAGVGGLFGFGEPALHAGFLVPAVAASLGIHSLAKRLCADPLLATAVAVCAPAFWVSSTLLGADTLMLAFWVWSLRLWIRGLDSGRAGPLATAALLAAAATLTKYFAAGLLPLFVVYTIARERRVSASLAWLALPLAILAAYQLGTAHLYGRGLLLDAGAYAVGFREEARAHLAQDLFVGVAFTGGSLVSTLCFAPLLWSRRGLLAGAAATLVAGAFAASQGEIGRLVLRDPAGGAQLWPVAQLALFAAAGLQVAALGARDLLRRRDADALLLVLCLGGTLAFALVLNWTVNARSLIALAPIAGILVARGLERPETRSAIAPARTATRWVALAPGLALGFAVALADHRLANSAREAAAVLAARHGTGDTPWFLGHWGWQWYLQEAGARPVLLDTGTLPAGSVLLVPENGSGIPEVPWSAVTVVEELSLPIDGWISTMSVHTRAGLHASVHGPLPFALGRVPPERYRAVRVDRALQGAGGRLVPLP